MIHVTKDEALKLYVLDLRSAQPERGQRGLINARWLGLSRHRYRRARPAKRRVVRRWQRRKL